jgi:alpha-D-xyloside xylohydrolase
MRPLIMDFNGDRVVNNIGDQYMFGPSIMVIPVYKYKARSREVYFPSQCGWYDFYSGKYLNGGQNQTVDAPYERIPLYIREGTIIPFGPEIQYTSEKPVDPITLMVYTGKDGEFTLYEDEGTNYNYEKGWFSKINFTYNEAKRELIIGERKGSFEGMVKSRTFNIVFISKNKPVPIDPLPTPDKTVTFDGTRISITENLKR